LDYEISIVVVRVELPCAEVYHLVACRLQFIRYFLLEIEAVVIGGNSDSHLPRPSKAVRSGNKSD
jgi:hypothetical protein